MEHHSKPITKEGRSVFVSGVRSSRSEPYSYLFIPADSNGAAGPNHVVTIVNTVIKFHNRSGTQLFSDSLKDFFTSLTPQTFTFDPKVIYDERAGRFLVITLEQTASPSPLTSRIFVAVSDDSNPIGTWYMLQINSKINIGGTDHWADYPGFGIDEDIPEPLRKSEVGTQ